MNVLSQSLFLFLAASSAQAITLVIDINDPGQANTFRYNDTAEIVSTFDISGYSQTDTLANRALLANNVLNEVIKDFHFDLGLATGNSSLNGMQLDIDVVLGDHGSAPSNGDASYYFIQVGNSEETGESALGRANGSSIRSSTGNVGYAPIGAIVGSVFTDRIDNLYNGGGMFEAVHLITGTLTHEIGHALSLDHLNFNLPWTTPNGLSPLLASGATGLPNAERRLDREFSLTGTNSSGQSINHVQQLINALGTRPIPEPSTTILVGLGILGTAFRRNR